MSATASSISRPGINSKALWPNFSPEQDGLVLVAVDPARLGAPLKWERSRGGAPFPHLYAPLDLAAMLWAAPLRLGDDGVHRLPEGVAV